MNRADWRRVHVWDLPVRVLHWALAACFVTAVASAMMGGNAMETHLYAGEALLVLTVTRVLWGFFGGDTARFGSFLRGPREVARYIRDCFTTAPRVDLGHNPLGGWMVMLLLTALLAQGITGLFANDDIMTEGPLYHLVGKDTSDLITSFHKLGGMGLIALASVHLLAILGYLLVKKENLVRPMLDGAKYVPASVDAAPPVHGSTRTALALLVLAATALVTALKLL